MLRSRIGVVLLFFGLCVLSALAQPPQPQNSGVNRERRQEHNEARESCVPAMPTGPAGLVVVIVDKPNNPTLDLSALSNPCISGVALQIHWAALEPVKGKPEWSKLDQLFAAADKQHKWVQLLIFPGFFSPSWALEGNVKSETFAIEYGPGKGTELPLPMPWNKVYLDRWTNFLKLVSERYGKEPSFRVIAAAGPTSVSVEMSLPQGPKNIKRWVAYGYTPSKYIEAWQRVLQACADNFPKQYVSLALGIGLNIDDQGKRHPGEGKRTRQTIIDHGRSLLGNRFVLQNSDLSAGPVEHPGPQFVIDYSGQVITGLQLRTSAERESADMGAAGNPPLALRKCIDLGMTPSRSGQHINYLEIYEPDVVANDMQPVLQYGASLFASRPPVAPKMPSKH